MTGRLLPKVEEWLEEGVRRNASDLFLIPGEPPSWRVKGELVRAEAPSLSTIEINDIALAAIGKEALSRIGREVGHVTRSFDAGTKAGRACICVARSRGEVTLTLMLLPPQIASIDQIKAPESLLNAVASHSGLVVISGATGSGKTTTAYSLLNHINLNSPRHICTVEEPMFVQLPKGKALVQQREVGVDVPDSLAGVQAAVKHDADVLFFNEIRGVEELQSCVAAVELGLLVITVLHLPTPEAALRRMIEVFPEDIRGAACAGLVTTLRAVSAQRLLPRADGRGRVAAYGVLIPDDEFRRAVAVDWVVAIPPRMPLPPGSQTLAEDIERLHREGVVTEEAANRALADL